MIALTALLVAAAAPAGKPAPAIAADPAPAPAVRPLASAADLAALCRALTPPDRLRTQGDALERGEARARAEAARTEAVVARYAVVVPAAKLAFAPYDAPERRLALVEPVVLPVNGARLWPTDERDLGVAADAAVARRVLDAQRAGRLALRLQFDLGDDADCGTGTPGAAAVLPVEPVEWAWLDGAAVVAQGGAAADRPVVSAAHGARLRVDVGEPIAGPSEAKKAVLARKQDLELCYAEALKKDPGMDGLVVVEWGTRLGIAADSTGAAGLGACLERALGTLPPLAGGVRAAVPIRFELLAPGTASAEPAAAPGEKP